MVYRYTRASFYIEEFIACVLMGFVEFLEFKVIEPYAPTTTFTDIKLYLIHNNM